VSQRLPWSLAANTSKDPLTIDYMSLKRQHVSASLNCSAFSHLLLVVDTYRRGFNSSRFLAVY
jgi:hypothetical protein